MAIIVNGKDIELMLNGKPVKQVLYNGKTIYPSKGRCSFICNDNNSNQRFLLVEILVELKEEDV